MSKVTKGVDEITIELADNGFIVKYSGRDDEDDWANDKVLVLSLQELFDTIKEVIKLK